MTTVGRDFYEEEEAVYNQTCGQGSEVMIEEEDDKGDGDEKVDQVEDRFCHTHPPPLQVGDIFEPMNRYGEQVDDGNTSPNQSKMGELFFYLSWRIISDIYSSSVCRSSAAVSGDDSAG